MSRLYGRLEGFEKSVNAVESGVRDGLVKVLREMLSKERKKSRPQKENHCLEPQVQDP